MLTREAFVKQLENTVDYGDTNSWRYEELLAHDAALRARVEKADELWKRIVEALAPREVENIEVAVLLIKQLASLTQHQGRLRWSSEKPTVPGWYWYRGGMDEVGPCICLVEKKMTNFIPGHQFRTQCLDGEWSGPVLPPEE